MSQLHSNDTEQFLDVFDHLVVDATDHPERLAADYGLPAEAAPLALGLAATALAGMREALARWEPHPPLEDDEVDGLRHAIAGLVVATTREALALLTDRRFEATMNARAALMAWNRGRHVTQHADHRDIVALS